MTTEDSDPLETPGSETSWLLGRSGPQTTLGTFRGDPAREYTDPSTGPETPERSGSVKVDKLPRGPPSIALHATPFPGPQGDYPARRPGAPDGHCDGSLSTPNDRDAPRKVVPLWVQKVSPDTCRAKNRTDGFTRGPTGRRTRVGRNRDRRVTVGTSPSVYGPGDD